MAAGEDAVDAPYGLLEPKWVKIQENTFTNWVNQQLRGTDHEVHDVGREFCDGVKLCGLVATLQNRPNIKGMKATPKNRHQMIENVTLALQATKLDKVKLVNIGPEDIVNGNKKLILGLVWSYILRYQIGKTEIPPKQLMLAWLHAVIPDCQIKNFTTDWNSGKALHALIDYCEPGLSPDWRNLSASNSEANCEQAMRLAQERLGVPLVVSPQHMASKDLDQLSGMTYLSYFMKIDSCGYKATLREVNKLLPSQPVFNFTSDWRDGSVVCALVEAVGGHVPALPQAGSTDSLLATNMERTHIGLQASREIGIEPILSADNMIQPQAGHLAVMAYAARFINRPVVKQSAAKNLEIMFNTVNITPGSKTQYSLLMKQGDPRMHYIQVAITDPSGKNVPTSVEWPETESGQGVGVFVPTVTGKHQLEVECDGEMIRGCPIVFNVTGNGNTVSVLKRDQGVVGEISKLEIVCDAGNAPDVEMICTSPTGQRNAVDLSKSYSGRALQNSFVPDTVGDWQVSVLSKGEHIVGSPFIMNVIEPHNVKLFDLKGGIIGEEFSFSVDTSEAGKAELQCIITSSGRVVPSTITSVGDHEYSVKFIPTGPGVHLIRPVFGGRDVRGEPYKVEIADSNLVLTKGQGLSLAKINHVAKFNVDVGNAGAGDVNVYMTDSSGGEVPCTVRQTSEREYDVQYTPLVIGQHRLEVMFAEKQVMGSPFAVNVYNDPTAEVPERGQVDQPVVIMLKTADTGTGDLNIIVNEGTVPVVTKKIAKGKHSAEFTPKEPGQFTVELEFNNNPIKGSPWYVNVMSAAEPQRSVTPPIPTYVPPPPQPQQEVTTSTTSSSDGEDTYAMLVKKPIARTASATDNTAPNVVEQGVPAQYAMVGKQRSFDVSHSNVQVKIQDRFGSNVPFTIDKKGNKITVSYVFKRIGDHYIHLQHSAKKKVLGSPFLVWVFDPDLVVVRDLESRGTVGVRSSFTVDASKAGKGQVAVKVDDGAVPCILEPQAAEGQYTASYTSTTLGTRYIDVLFNNVAIAGSPFTCSYGTPEVERKPEPAAEPVPRRASGAAVTHVVPTPSVSAAYVMSAPAAADYSSITAHGDGLHICEEDKVAFFTIDHSGHQGQPNVRIEGPHSVAKCDVQPLEGDKYKVSYVPLEAGIYNVHIKWNGVELTGSPFHPRVIDSRAVKLDGDWRTHLDEEGRLKLTVSQTKRLLFDVTRAGPGELKASGRYLASGEPLQCVVSERDQFHYWVDVLAGEPGDAVLDITWSDYAIPQCPLSVVAMEPVANGHVVKRHKVVLSGDGYLEPTLGVTTEFYIDGSLAETGSPQVTLKNSRLNSLPVTLESLNSGQEFRCTYIIEEPGMYMLHVSWNNQPLDESPFTLIAKDKTPSVVSSAPSDGPDKITVHGPGIHPGILANFEGKFYIDTESAGRGECEVKIKGPKGDVKCKSSLAGPKRRLIECEYEPTEVGLYVILVKWSGQDVACSPIKVYLFDTYEELNKFKNSDELPLSMAPLDSASIYSHRLSVPPRVAMRSRSVPQVANGYPLAVQGPPQRSYTAGPRLNGTAGGKRNIYEGKISYFVVEENGPQYVRQSQKKSVFLANH